MRLFNRKPKVTYKEFQELQAELREVRHEVFPSEAYSWITIGWGGKKANPTRFEQTDEKLALLAKELGLEFSSVKDNFSLQKPQPKEQSKDTYGLKTIKVD